jgi:hypothetical protein
VIRPASRPSALATSPRLRSDLEEDLARAEDGVRGRDGAFAGFSSPVGEAGRPGWWCWRAVRGRRPVSVERRVQAVAAGPR